MVQKSNKEHPSSCLDIYILSEGTDCALSILILELCEVLLEKYAQVVWRGSEKARNLT